MYFKNIYGFDGVNICGFVGVSPPPNENADSLGAALALMLCKDIFVTITVCNACFGNKLLAHNFGVIQKVAQLLRTVGHERKTLCCLFIGKFTNSA